MGYKEPSGRDFTQILQCLLEIARILNYMNFYEKHYDKASVDQIVNPC